MLTVEEQQHKDGIITFTNQVYDAKRIECDSKYLKLPGQNQTSDANIPLIQLMIL
jgi:hypothetical protein